jgi:hypothetical protein
MQPVIARAALSLTLVLTFVPALAQAQDLGFGAHARPRGQAVIMPRWDTYAFGENIDGVGGARTNLTSWANVFSGQLDFNQWVVNVAVPVGFAHLNTTALGGSSTDDQAELGNIELEGFADIDLGPEHRLLIGGGIALPTATDQLTVGATGTFRGQVVRTVAWATSFRNPAAWADQSFGLWPSASYRFASEWVLVTATGSIPFFFPTNSDVGGPVLHRGNVEMMLTIDVAAAVRIVDIVDAGVSFLGWAMPSGAGAMGNPDLGQTAATIFVRTDDALDLPVGGGFEMIFNLDNGWGPTGDSGKLWGAHIFLYGRFDVGPSGTVTEADWDPATTDPAAPAPATTDGSATSY